jgi:hypothetical protein
MTAKPARWQTVVVLLVPVLLLVFMFTPAIIAAHRVHQQVACKKRLEALYAAIRAYQQVHGKYPDKLSNLYPMFVRDLEAFECPAQSRRIHAAEDIDTLSGYVLFPPDLGEWGRKYGMKPLLCDRRRNHPFKWKACWHGAVLYEDEGMPEIFWIFDTRSVFPPDCPPEFVGTNRYDFPE